LLNLQGVLPSALRGVRGCARERLNDPPLSQGRQANQHGGAGRAAPRPRSRAPSEGTTFDVAGDGKRDRMSIVGGSRRSNSGRLTSKSRRSCVYRQRFSAFEQLANLVAESCHLKRLCRHIHSRIGLVLPDRRVLREADSLAATSINSGFGFAGRLMERASIGVEFERHNPTVPG
jgi:hypothetical protein